MGDFRIAGRACAVIASGAALHPLRADSASAGPTATLSATSFAASTGPTTSPAAATSATTATAPAASTASPRAGLQSYGSRAIVSRHVLLLLYFLNAILPGLSCPALCAVLGLLPRAYLDNSPC